MTNYTVSSGVTDPGPTVLSGDTLTVTDSGTVIGATVSSGGVEFVYASGIASNTTVSSGGVADVYSGGTARGAVVTDTGEQQVYFGATAFATTVSNGGLDFVFSGTASGTTVGNAGFEYVYSGGRAVGAIVNSGGNEYVYSSGTASNTQVKIGGNQIINDGGTASGTTVSGGTETLLPGATDIQTTLSDGGHEIVQAGGTASGAMVGNGGFLYVGGQTFNATVSAGGFEYVSAGGIASNTVVNSGGTVVVSSGGTVAGITVKPGGILTLLPGSIDSPCYAAGTRIATSRGDIAVELLTVGDLVRTHSGGLSPVKWLGHRSVDIGRHLRPWDVHPVRIRAGAFAAGRPQRDLLLSPDHAVFVEDVLIPVRYLINGATVVQEAARQVTYWHVELDRHDVILAEGLACESYLDTGNRGAFANGDAPTQIHPEFALKVWEAAACAPLVVSGARLERAQAGLRDGLARLGYGVTAEPALRCVTGNGETLVPQLFGDWMCVALPDGAATLRLVSRHFAPAELDPASTDRRRLGVALTGLRLDGETALLDHPRLLSGWQDCEAELRWTDGEAVLDVSGVSVVELRLARLPARYVMPPAALPRNAAAA